MRSFHVRAVVGQTSDGQFDLVTEPVMADRVIVDGNGWITFSIKTDEVTDKGNNIYRTSSVFKEGWLYFVEDHNEEPQTT